MTGSRPSLAADLQNCEAMSSGICAACHAGGNNNASPEKKIKNGSAFEAIK